MIDQCGSVTMSTVKRVHMLRTQGGVVLTKVGEGNVIMNENTIKRVQRSYGHRTLGMVIFGQAPRNDVLPQMMPFLPPDVTIRQLGALDNLDLAKIADLVPRSGEYVLLTRLRDGRAVYVAAERTLPLVQNCLDRLSGEGVNLVILLCTREFPALHTDVILIESSRLLPGIVRALSPKHLGIMVPLPEQIGYARSQWETLEASLAFIACSPYTDEQAVAAAARELAKQSLDLVVMDCMGYTLNHKRIVVEVTQRPVLLATSVLARITGELLG
ncbi:MAG: AroM family protein [Chloroflexi bacterium]|nr:AroM family protein [Chloroflexota bacterium]MCL5074060.1 AroM family protein [Chloroflexota bacterium]